MASSVFIFYCFPLFMSNTKIYFCSIIQPFITVSSITLQLCFQHFLIDCPEREDVSSPRFLQQEAMLQKAAAPSALTEMPLNNLNSNLSSSVCVESFDCLVSCPNLFLQNDKNAEEEFFSC